MNKRSILFTITTIYLLLAVFLLSSSYLARNSDLQRTATLSLAGDRLAYVYDDVADNIYYGLLSVNLESISKDTYTTIIFNHSNLTSSIDHRQIMQDYKTFIEGIYSALNNIDVQLTGFNNSFSISPYNSTFVIDGDLIYIYTAALNKTRLAISVDETSSNISQGQPTSNGNIEVEVAITHSSGTYNQTASLDPAAVSNPFYINFNSSSRIEVRFGRYNNKDGTLIINASQLKADIHHLELDYNMLEEETLIKGGNISITYPVENITKQTEMIIG